MCRNTILYVANTSWYLFNFRLNILRAMRRRGWQVVVAAPRDTYGIRLEAFGFRLVELKVDRKGYNFFRECFLFLRLYRILKSVNPRLVHFITIKPVIYGTFAARWLQVSRIVNEVPGLGYVFLQPNGLQSLIRALYRLAFQGKQVQVIFQNPDNRDFFSNNHLINKRKTTIILGAGVNINRFRPIPREVVSRGKTVRFGLISRMLWDKGIGEFIKAAQSLWKRYPKTSFELLGDSDPGNPNAIPSSWLRENIDTRCVHWHGHVEDIRSMLKTLDIVVLPSRYLEGVPQSLIEAAAMGKPLITTDTPGCREIVRHGENGLLVPPGSVRALETAMEKLLLDSDLRRRMGQASRERAVRYFSDETVVRQTLNVYGLTPPEPG